MKIKLPVLAAVVCGYSLIPSYLLRYLQKVKRSRKCREECLGRKVLYLTFDDGPSSRYTPQLLDLLKEYQIKASFFTVAQSAADNPELIARMKAEGHLIGIHSVRHQNALFRGGHFTYRDLNQSVRTLAHLGCHVHYYRPPWGHLNLFTLYFLHRMNLHLVFWDVMAEDWEGDTTSGAIYDKILSRIYPGAMICLHDGRGGNEAPGRTLEALKKALPELLESGYEFRTVDTICNGRSA